MSCTLVPYNIIASYLVKSFDNITFKHISRIWNTDANELAQIASGTQLMGGKIGRAIPVIRWPYLALVNQQVLQQDHVIRTRVMSLPSLLELGDPVNVCVVEALPDDWRRPIMRYHDNPSGKHDRRTMVHATNYISYQNELYQKWDDGLLLLYRLSNCRNTRRNLQGSSIWTQDALAASQTWLILAEYIEGLYRVCKGMHTVSN